MALLCSQTVDTKPFRSKGSAALFMSRLRCWCGQGSVQTIHGCGQGSVQMIRGPLACKQGVGDAISVETLFQQLLGLLGLLRRPYNQEVSAVVQEEQKKKRGTYHRLSPGMTAIGTYCRVVVICIISILAVRIVRVRKLLNIPRNGGEWINRGVIQRKMRASWKLNRQLCTDIP